MSTGHTNHSRSPCDKVQPSPRLCQPYNHPAAKTSAQQLLLRLLSPHAPHAKSNSTANRHPALNPCSLRCRAPPELPSPCRETAAAMQAPCSTSSHPVVSLNQPAPCRTARTGELLRVVAAGAIGTKASDQQEPVCDATLAEKGRQPRAASRGSERRRSAQNRRDAGLGP